MSTSTEPSRARRLLPAVALVVAGVAADQATKAWAVATLDHPVPILGGLLHLRLLYNPGAAFSLGESVTWLYTVVAGAVSVAIIVALPRIRNLWWLVTLSVLLAGALGNFIDRIVQPPRVGQGHVIDFIDYGPFVGNVADIFIVGAAAVLVLLNLRGVPTGAPPRADDEPGEERP